jgi:hypothetical protein
MSTKKENINKLFLEELRKAKFSKEEIVCIAACLVTARLEAES